MVQDESKRMINVITIHREVKMNVFHSAQQSTEWSLMQSEGLNDWHAGSLALVY